MAWLAQRGFLLQSLVRPVPLWCRAYSASTSNRSWGQVPKLVVQLTRLWGFGQFSARPNGIGGPAWGGRGVGDYLPAAAAAGGENMTGPLAGQAMGPLLSWAMRMADGLSGGILAGWAGRQRLVNAAVPAPPRRPGGLSCG